MLTVKPMDILESPLNLTLMFLDCGRKPENSEKTLHENMLAPHRKADIRSRNPVPPYVETGYQPVSLCNAITTATDFNKRETDLKEVIIKSRDNSTTSYLPRLNNKVPLKSLLEDMNPALQTVPTNTIIDTNRLICAAATVICYF